MSSWSPASGLSWGSYLPSVKTVSSAVCGAGAVASEVLGAVSSSVPREAALSQWMPPSVQAYLPGRDPQRNADDRDQVVSATFDVDIGSPVHPQFLCMCFTNGFQVWEVQDQSEGNTQATRETQPLREVLSVRQAYTRLVKVLPSVAVPEHSVLYGHQPALAVVSGSEVGDSKVLRVFSVRGNALVHQLRFHGDVHGVVCNAKSIIVVLKNQLLVHSLQDLSLSQTYSTFPSPTPHGVLALGPRWLAYASNQPLRTDGAGAAPTTTYGSPLLDVGVGVAGMAASGAKQLGELGLRTLNSYLSSSPPTLAEPIEPALDYAGSVIVRDMDTQQVLHHFRAHDAPLGLIKFDPSGLLLVTAAVDGHNINLFEVNPDAGRSAPGPPKHLYKLVRGVTSSTIQDIAFSVDSRWVAVTSNRGTAHLYPINSDGSPATVDTHVPSPAMNAVWPLYPLSASYAAVPSSPITVFAVARIRTSDGGAASGAGGGEGAAACVQFCLPSVSTVYTQYPPAVSAVFVVSGDGVLARYQLRPYAMAEADTQSETLQLEMQCQGTLDIGRRRTWPEQRCPSDRLQFWASKPQSPPSQMAGCMPEWVSHVEIYTHERKEESVWASRMFQFKSFDTRALPKHSPGSHALHFEQIPCVQLGGALSPSPDGCTGEEVEDLDDYFVVQTCPKPGVVSMHNDGVPHPGRPAGLEDHFQTHEPAAGVYGGLPRASLGAGEGSREDAVSAAAGALPSLSKSRSMDIVGSSSAPREETWHGDDIFAAGAEGGNLIDLDWGGEGSEEEEAGVAAGGDEEGSPGLAASSMMMFDEDFGGEAVTRMSEAATRDRWQAGLGNFALQEHNEEEMVDGKGGLDGSCAAASDELNAGAFYTDERAEADQDLADFLASSASLSTNIAAAGQPEQEFPPTVMARAAQGEGDAAEEDAIECFAFEEDAPQQDVAAGVQAWDDDAFSGLDTRAEKLASNVSASPDSPLSPAEGEESPPEVADPDQEEGTDASAGGAMSKKDKRKKKKKAKR